MEINKIYNESCLETLRRMPDEFLDCVVTSPPYYGLRSYKTTPQVWDGIENCAHVFGEESVQKVQLQAGNPEFQRPWREGATDETASNGAFCTCGAWRGELGLEPTFQMYIGHLITIFREIKRCLKKDGTVWVNLADSYYGAKGKSGGASAEQQAERAKNGQSYNKEYTQLTGKGITRPTDGKQSVPRKSLLNIPARFAIAMTDELGFVLRNEINWHKLACMPSSAKDRFTIDFEKIFFFTKSPKYYFEQQLEPNLSKNSFRYAKAYDTKVSNGNGQPNNINHQGIHARPGDEDNRNMRTTWTVNFEPSTNEHYAPYPTRLVEIPIKAGCPVDGLVYDPFTGTATTQVVAYRLGRNFIGSELQENYYKIATERLTVEMMQQQLF